MFALGEAKQRPGTATEPRQEEEEDEEEEGVCTCTMREPVQGEL